MKRTSRTYHFSLIVFLAAAVVFASCTTSPLITAPSPAQQINVKLIAFNDFHGNLKTPSLRVPVPDPSRPDGVRMEKAGGVEQFAAVVQTMQEKNPNHAVLSAGDMVGATPLLSALFKDEPTIEAMNLIGVDFHAVGNHEFDYGIAHLKRLKNGGCALNNQTSQPDCGGREPYKGADFPFLAANVIETATGKPLFPPYEVKAFEGVKIAFIGLTLKGTSAIVRPGSTQGVDFRDEVTTVNELIPVLKAQGIEAIVVIVHEGGEQTGGINDCTNFKGPLKTIAEKLDRAVDVVISAHTHRYYVCEIDGKLVTSAGSYGTLITDIDLTLNRNSRDIVAKHATNRVVDPAGQKDPRLTALVDRYSKLAEPLEKRVIAKVSQELPTLSNPAGESLLGNLIADAHLFATAAPDKGGAVIAFNNPGSLRASLIPGPDGNVSYGDLFKVQPFQNELITMTLTGTQIKAVLEQQFAGERPRILGVSKGFSYTWDNKRPTGDKVLRASLKLNGTALQPDLQYRVTTNSFIAGGSEGLSIFREGTERQTGMLDLEALATYLSAQSPYSPPAQERITRID